MSIGCISYLGVKSTSLWSLLLVMLFYMVVWSGHTLSTVDAYFLLGNLLHLSFSSTVHGPLSSYLLLASENYHFWSSDITLFMLSIFLSHYMVVLDLFVSSEKGLFPFLHFYLVFLIYYFYLYIIEGLGMEIYDGSICVYTVPLYIFPNSILPYHIFLKEQLFSESLVYLCCVVTDHEYITVCWTKVFLWFVPWLGTILNIKW